MSNTATYDRGGKIGTEMVCLLLKPMVNILHSTKF